MIGKKINQLATELAPVSTDLTIIGDPISGVSKKITLAQLGAIFSGAVSFYTNLAGFPALGDINVIYCAKDTKKLYLWDGTTYVEVFPAQALLDTYQLRSEKGVSNGYASLDSGGKVPISQLPSSIMEYKGTWNAATNTPTLANGTGDTGDVYICNVAGTVNFGAGAITFAVGDYVIYSGSIWQRSSGAVGTVTSVAASITGNSIGITGSPVTTSGTLAFAFAGTGAQYIKGDGTLATFPSTIAQAERLITEVYNSTGATLTKGTIVYINGGQGNLPTVTKALATGDSTSAQTFGVVQADITNNNNGYVVVAGKLSDLDTQAYTEGTQLYLSSTTAGAWTSTKQYAPNHLVYVGIVVRAHPTQGIVEIKIQNGYELDELHNVAAQTPSNNDGLFWESATSLWKNKSIATVLGYTPQAQLNGTGFVKASGTTISYDNSTYVTTDTFQTISASKTFSVGLSLASAGGTNQLTSFINTSSLFSGSGGSNVLGFNSANNIYFGKGLDNGGVLQWNNSAVRYYTLPDATGTIALVGGAGVGTVTSVGLSSATSGVTIGSSPVTTSGTITLAIATASGLQNGLLSSSDWTTFNNKQDALTNPVTGTGTTNYLPKFTGTSTIGNSIVSESGAALSVSGTITASGRITINGNNDLAFYGASSSTGYMHLQLSNTGNTTRVAQEGSTGGNMAVGSSAYATILNSTGAYSLQLATNNNVRATIDASGNLGLGVTPSAWSVGSAIDIAQGPAILGFVNETYLSNNAYFNSGWKFKQTSYATMYVQNSTGEHRWHIGGTGTAGNAISFTQAMTLDASGRLGIGTTSPGNYYSTKLVVAVGDEDGITIAGSGDNFLMFADGQTGLDRYRGFIHYNHDSNFLAFGSDGVERLRIASTGAATFSSSVTANGLFTAQGAISSAPSTSGTTINGSAVIKPNDGSNAIIMGAYGTAPYGNWIQSQSTSGLGTTFPLILQPIGGNVGIGTTSPGNFSGVSFSAPITDLVTSLNIRGRAADGVSIINMGGETYRKASIYTSIQDQDPYLAFATGSSGSSSSGFERMRITSGGQVCINQTAGLGAESLEITSTISGGAQYGILVTGSPASYTNYAMRFHYSGVAIVGSITFNTTSTSYNTSSDYRLKTDYKDFSGLDLVSKIKAYDYEWKSDKSRSYGVIAHELQSVINYAVTGVKDGKEMQGVDYSKIVPVLIKAIQEQQQQIEQLKNK